MENNTISTIENATLIYKNFAGRAGDYNNAGTRSFSVLITDPEMAERMAQDGWLIKPLKKRNEEDPQHWHLPVAVGYKMYPPEIIMINSKNSAIHLTEDMLDRLDFATLLSVDLTIRARIWESRGKSGVKAYLKKMYFRIEEDPLDEKYADLM